MEHRTKTAAFWFHLGIGILTLAIMIGMAAFIAGQVESGVFPWWVYLVFSVYVIIVLAVDHALFNKNQSESPPNTH